MGLFPIDQTPLVHHRPMFRQVGVTFQTPLLRGILFEGHEQRLAWQHRHRLYLPLRILS
ncbi:hypothetical protein HanIR_Chr04g0199841 [Helianthus annuus]|nr:hypothetical protein HanIR_Chr04g0199841 [Helianthus annuus]